VIANDTAQASEIFSIGRKYVLNNWQKTAFFVDEYRIRVNFEGLDPDEFLDEFNEFLEKLRTRPTLYASEMSDERDLGGGISGYVRIETTDAADAFLVLMSIAGAFVEN